VDLFGEFRGHDEGGGVELAIGIGWERERRGGIAARKLRGSFSDPFAEQVWMRSELTK